MPKDWLSRVLMAGAVTLALWAGSQLGSLDTLENRVRALETGLDKQSARQISPADFTDLGEKVYAHETRLSRVEVKAARCGR